MLICFDYDGVLADTFDDLLHICQSSWRGVECGRCPEEDDFRTIRNLTFDSLAEQLEIPSERVDEYRQLVLSALAEGGADVVFEEVPGIIKALAEKHTLCVVTANTVPKITTTLQKAGIADNFSLVLGGEEGLPKSSQITHARETLGFSATDTVMVGDTLGDIRMAKVAEVHSIAVLWGYQDRETLADGDPDYFACSTGEFSTIIDRLDRAHRDESPRQRNPQ